MPRRKKKKETNSTIIPIQPTTTATILSPDTSSRSESNATNALVTIEQLKLVYAHERMDFDWLRDFLQNYQRENQLTSDEAISQHREMLRLEEARMLDMEVFDYMLPCDYRDEHY